ncbi:MULTISPECIES: FMN-dependent NADH-azoreductase [Gluconobacter]|uniref:FMN dependent NADH:quinone oxidoreductase n=1 Tax=Gluconobacter cerinus TaxID=38307 RepID=A0A1B6VGX6_9PROT|nr:MULTISPECIES: NAD(P)H-dependent oxidoreductase [Gluconobacter]MBS1020232.1 NAD(P)H-dependent oxidoreductase [Gluconobacter cerinus]MBS1063946.1 NAD(P)H-dependent oxidoreductase [Gluconobacter wancherniae]MBS1069972.1 NAD(P)H-dependent oxidoreductase [Gluconobacter cerinus]MBS1072722.1 NAD(P)H-dependent oxidoreductase [Gluconobacter cerinus]MCP1237471.1 NAD(P)H-dependent oxidoreductase [Gluconobacter kondonii]
MPKLLNVTASPRGAHSISRRLGQLYVDRWRALHPGGQVVDRDLVGSGIPYLGLDWIAGVYAPPEVPRTPDMDRALVLSAALIAEIVEADEILISAPMYNFSVPAVVKSWIDYLVRPGFTFELAPGWPGLLQDKPVRVLIATRDHHVAGGEDDLVTPVIRRAFAFMGVTDVVSLLAGGSLGVNRGEVAMEDHVAGFAKAVAGMVPA